MPGAPIRVLTLAALLGCTPIPAGNQSPDPSASQTPTHQVQTVTVTVKDFAFTPPTVTIASGSTVTWSFQDSMAHSATSDSGSAKQWDSGIKTSGTYSVTFDQTGSFPYHCTPHPDQMKGTVVVQ